MLITIWAAGALVTLWIIRRANTSETFWVRFGAFLIVSAFWPITWTIALVQAASRTK